jgi:hypothetical protein
MFSMELSGGCWNLNSLGMSAGHSLSGGGRVLPPQEIEAAGLDAIGGEEDSCK